MNRIAAVSVIKGSGACDVYMNYVVGKEMKRLQAIERKENEGLRQRMALVTNSRDKLLNEKLERLISEDNYRRPFYKRLWDKAVQAYCVFFAMCMELGFIEYVGNEKRGYEN